ncbi:MAG: sigma-70 family RNA polymerase sigma factor [Pseudomonadota bacterium]
MTADGSFEAVSDETLIARIAEDRDRDAFAELFRRFAGRVKAFMMRGGMDPLQAEDIAQEVMVSVWRRADSFDPGRARAVTWIYTIARNRRIDLIRRQSRPEADPNDPLFVPDPEPDPATLLAAADRDAHVRAALESLPPDQLMVVQLAFFGGLTHSEIAEQLAAPIGTVKSRLRLSFARLRSALGDGFESELVDD